jgi:hypothetical protein
VRQPIEFLGHATLGGVPVATVNLVTVVENLRTLEAEALVSVEFFDGETRLWIMPYGYDGHGSE